VDPVAAENPPSTGDFLERNMGKPSNKKVYASRFLEGEKNKTWTNLYTMRYICIVERQSTAFTVKKFAASSSRFENERI
jgi:hypothetical protein